MSQVRRKNRNVVKNPWADLTRRQQIAVTTFLLARTNGSYSPVADAANESGLNYNATSQLLLRDDIQALMASMRKEQWEKLMRRYEITEERVFEGYLRLIEHDPAAEFERDEDGKFIQLHVAEMDRATRMSLGVRPSDRKAALDSIARIQGMFQDKLEISTIDSILKEVAELDGSDEPLVHEDD